MELWRIGVIVGFIITIGIFSFGCEKEIQNNAYMCIFLI